MQTECQRLPPDVRQRRYDLLSELVDMLPFVDSIETDEETYVVVSATNGWTQRFRLDKSICKQLDSEESAPVFIDDLCKKVETMYVAAQSLSSFLPTKDVQETCPTCDGTVDKLIKKWRAVSVEIKIFADYCPECRALLHLEKQACGKWHVELFEDDIEKKKQITKLKEKRRQQAKVKAQIDAAAEAVLASKPKRVNYQTAKRKEREAAAKEAIETLRKFRALERWRIKGV